MIEDELLKITNTFNKGDFSTFDFILKLQEMFPARWEQIKNKYGAGGKGAGKHFSANSCVSQYLDKFANHNLLNKLEYRKSPPGWGSPVIRYWSIKKQVNQDNLYPDEIPDSDTVTEGAKKTITVNKYERDRKARAKCIEKYGVICLACQFDFEKIYGSIGAGLIHIHHIKPISEIGSEYQLNPEEDLVPLCPNGHAIVHRRTPVLSIEERRNLLNNKI